MAIINLIVIGQESTLTQAEVSSFITPGFSSKYKIKYIKTAEKEITPADVHKLISTYDTGFEQDVTIIVNLCNFSRILKIDKEGDLRNARYVLYSETQGEHRLREQFQNVEYLGMLDSVSGGSDLLKKIEGYFSKPQNKIKNQTERQVNISNDFSFDENAKLNNPLDYFSPNGAPAPAQPTQTPTQNNINQQSQSSTIPINGNNNQYQNQYQNSNNYINQNQSFNNLGNNQTAIPTQNNFNNQLNQMNVGNAVNQTNQISQNGQNGIPNQNNQFVQANLNNQNVQNSQNNQNTQMNLGNREIQNTQKDNDLNLTSEDMMFFSYDTIEDLNNTVSKTEEQDHGYNAIKNTGNKFQENPLESFNSQVSGAENNYPWGSQNNNSGNINNEPYNVSGSVNNFASSNNGTVNNLNTPNLATVNGHKSVPELMKEKNNLDEIDLQVAYDTGRAKKPARLITVYSAKGGVGKTTVATELATYLSLTAHGRDTFKVLIVDYNIDFGDVLGTMDFNPKKPTLTNFVADIRQRKAQNIPLKYKTEDIKRFIQTDPRSGLDALVAPINNLESMSITNNELSFILKTVVKNGGYDFVICDTGNNTRDSSFIALEQAETIIMVLTQSVNTANCNDGMLMALYELYKDSQDFNFNKFTIVVNQIKSGKALGIEPEELVEAILNPATGERFDCIGMINDDDAVKKSNNEGVPVVFNPSSSFTKSISQIAAYLIGEKPNTQDNKRKKKKKNPFSKIFKK